MKTLARTLVILAALLLAAHFLRAGLWPLVLAALFAPLLLLFTGTAAVRTLQSILAAGAATWAWTLFQLVAERREAGRPFGRLALILAAVAVLSAAAAWLAPRGQRQGIG